MTYTMSAVGHRPKDMWSTLAFADNLEQQRNVQNPLQYRYSLDEKKQYGGNTRADFFSRAEQLYFQALIEKRLKKNGSVELHTALNPGTDMAFARAAIAEKEKHKDEKNVQIIADIFGPEEFVNRQAGSTKDLDANKKSQYAMNEAKLMLAQMDGANVYSHDKDQSGKITLSVNALDHKQLNEYLHNDWDNQAQAALTKAQTSGGKYYPIPGKAYMGRGQNMIKKSSEVVGVYNGNPTKMDQFGRAQMQKGNKFVKESTTGHLLSYAATGEPFGKFKRDANGQYPNTTNRQVTVVSPIAIAKIARQAGNQVMEGWGKYENKPSIKTLAGEDVSGNSLKIDRNNYAKAVLRNLHQPVNEGSTVANVSGNNQFVPENNPVANDPNLQAMSSVPDTNFVPDNNVSQPVMPGKQDSIKVTELKQPTVAVPTSLKDNTNVYALDRGNGYQGNKPKLEIFDNWEQCETARDELKGSKSGYQYHKFDQVDDAKKWLQLSSKDERKAFTDSLKGPQTTKPKTTYYAVYFGRDTGVFTNYQDVKKSVSGFKDAEFHKFATEDLANQYLNISDSAQREMFVNSLNESKAKQNPQKQITQEFLNQKQNPEKQTTQKFLDQKPDPQKQTVPEMTDDLTSALDPIAGGLDPNSIKSSNTPFDIDNEQVAQQKAQQKRTKIRQNQQKKQAEETNELSTH